MNDNHIASLVERLRIHSVDERNTAFSRSTMREVLEVLSAPRASYGSGMIDAIEDFAPVPRADADTAGAFDCGECACLPGICDKEQELEKEHAAFQASMHKYAQLDRDADGTYVNEYVDSMFKGWLLHRTNAAAGASNERADAEKDAALTDEQINAAVDAWFGPLSYIPDNFNARMRAAILAAIKNKENNP
jgi:hypothetical protein